MQGHNNEGRPRVTVPLLKEGCVIGGFLYCAHSTFVRPLHASARVRGEAEDGHKVLRVCRSCDCLAHISRAQATTRNDCIDARKKQNANACAPFARRRPCARARKRTSNTHTHKLLTHSDDFALHKRSFDVILSFERKMCRIIASNYAIVVRN